MPKYQYAEARHSCWSDRNARVRFRKQYRYSAWIAAISMSFTSSVKLTPHTWSTQSDPFIGIKERTSFLRLRGLTGLSWSFLNSDCFASSAFVVRYVTLRNNPLPSSEKKHNWQDMHVVSKFLFGAKFDQHSWNLKSSFSQKLRCISLGTETDLFHSTCWHEQAMR